SEVMPEANPVLDSEVRVFPSLLAGRQFLERCGQHAQLHVCRLEFLAHERLRSEELPTAGLDLLYRCPAGPFKRVLQYLHSTCFRVLADSTTASQMTAQR